MSNKDNIDKLFQEKLDGRNFKFDEASWNKMEAMLPTSIDVLFQEKLQHREVPFNEKAWSNMEKLLQANSPKPFYYNKLFISFAAGAALLISGTYYFASNSTEISINENNKISEVSLKNSSISEVEKAIEKNFDATQLHDSQNQSNQLVLNTLKDNQEVLENSNFKSNEKSLSSYTNSNTNTDLVHPNSTNISLSSSLNSENISTPEKSTENATQANSTLHNSLDSEKTLVQHDDSFDHENQTANSNNTPSSGTFISNDQLSIDRQSPSHHTNENKEETLTSISTEDRFSEIIEIPSNRTKEEILFADKLENKEEEKVIWTNDKYTPKSPTQNSLSLIGGINIGKNIENKNGATFGGNEWGGILYTRNLKGNFSLSSGVTFQNRRTVGASKEFEAVVYGFGNRTEQTSISTTSIQYLETPVFVNYTILGQHNVFIGGTFSYLLNAYSKVDKHITTLENNWMESSNEFGHTNGFNKFDASTLVGYEWLFSSKFSVGAQVNFGLMDVSKNSYYTNSTHNSNTQFKVHLRYNLLDF